MLKLTTLTVTIFLQYIECSIVIDSASQLGVHVSEYCPKMEYCPEGAHVICMYYNPKKKMGPACSHPKDVSFTRALADRMVIVTNALRSRLATGVEKGKDEMALPKVYGMFKFEWDSELATFAQVLANQCVLRHDTCRATKRFPDPGQTMGLVRFNLDWTPLHGADPRLTENKEPGLTSKKVENAIFHALRVWYQQKKFVTPAMITNFPDWSENPNKQQGRLYLEMMHSSATHMGCGVSAYTEYRFYEDRQQKNYNVILVICNFSSRPRKGGLVAEVKPPTEEGYTVKCGCPFDADEDKACLCYYNRTVPESYPCPDLARCKPAMVVLPIFTTENAPPEKLNVRTGFDNMLPYEKRESEVEIPDLYAPTENSSVLHPLLSAPTNIQSVLGNIINDVNSKINQQMPIGNPIMVEAQFPLSNSHRKPARIGYSHLQVKEPQSVMSSLVNEVRHNANLRITTPHSNPLIRDVQKRVFGKHPLGYHYKNTVHPSGNRYLHRKSVFSKVATFELPKTGEKNIKPDVAPRKDFTNVKNIAKDYLNFKKGQKKTYELLLYRDVKHKKDSLRFKTTTERFLNSAEDKVMNYNYYLNNFSQPKNKPAKGLFEFDSIYSKDKSKDKLMTLLDKLEQEVKHIELDRNKKEMFDAKIRKIYGTVVGEPRLLDHKTDYETDFTDGELTDFDKFEAEHNRHSDVEGKRPINKPHHIHDIEEIEKNVENMHDKYSDLINAIRPRSRSRQNTLYMDKPENHFDQRNIKTARDGYESDMKHPLSDVEEIRRSLHKDILSGHDMKNYDKEVLRTRTVYSDIEDKKSSKYSETRKLRGDDDPLDVDRRRYYQNKLDNLERKLHNTRSFKHHKDSNNRQIRPVLPAVREEQPLRRSKNQPDPFYMPDRARFLHGF